MAGVAGLTGVFALINRKMIHRTSFRFGMILGYGFGVMLVRLLANLLMVSNVLAHHPDYDYSGFFDSSLAIISLYGLCVIPLFGARTAAGIPGHPRLAGAEKWKLALAHLIFTMTRLHFLGLLGILGLYAASLAKSLGYHDSAILILIRSSFLFAAGGMTFHGIFRLLTIRPSEAESLLLASIALAVFVNPSPSFRDGIVTISLDPGLSGLLTGATAGGLRGAIVQAACILPGILLLAATHLLGRLERFLRRLTSRRVFPRLLSARLPLLLPVGTACAELYILAWPGRGWIKLIMVGGLALYTSIRAAGAFSSAGEDIFRLYRRGATVRHFLPSALAIAAILAAPLIFHAVSR